MMTEYQDAPIQSSNESLSVAIDMAEDATSNPPAAAPEQQPSVSAVPSTGTTSLTAQFQYGSVVWSTAERLLEYLGSVWRNVQREWTGIRQEYLSAVCRLHACWCVYRRRNMLIARNYCTYRNVENAICKPLPHVIDNLSDALWSVAFPG